MVKTQRSRDMIAALKAAGGEPRYTEYPNTGHNSWTATYANREIYAWLFAQKLGERGASAPIPPDSPRTIRGFTAHARQTV